MQPSCICYHLYVFLKSSTHLLNQYVRWDKTVDNNGAGFPTIIDHYYYHLLFINFFLINPKQRKHLKFFLEHQ